MKILRLKIVAFFILNKGLFIIVMISALFVGCAHNSVPNKYYTREQMLQYKVSRTAGDALSTVILLESLRSGEVDSVIDVLESSLDSYYKMLTHTNFHQNVTNIDWIQTAIEEIKRYRKENTESVR